MKIKFKILIIIACLLLAAYIAYLGMDVQRMDAERADAVAQMPQTGYETENRWKLAYNGEEHKVGSYVATYLFVGTDTADRDASDMKVTKFYNHSQADVIMLFAVDEKSKKVTAIQINRDTMTDVPWLDVIGQYGGTVFEQIALAYNSGSGGEDSLKNTADAVSKLLFGLPVDHCAAFTMAGIDALNDLVGGVTVKIKDDLTPVDTALKKGRTVTLRGKQAEHFLRARMVLEDDTNSARMSRHRDYIDGFLRSAREAAEDDPGFFVKAFRELSPYTVTDMSSEELSYFADTVQKYGIDSIRYAEGELREGEFYEFYPDMDSLWSIVCEVFNIS